MKKQNTFAGIILFLLLILFLYGTPGSAESEHTVIYVEEPCNSGEPDSFGNYETWQATPMEVPVGSYEEGYYEIKGTLTYDDPTDVIVLKSEYFKYNSHYGYSELQRSVQICFSCEDNETDGQAHWNLLEMVRDEDCYSYITDPFQQTGAAFKPLTMWMKGDDSARGIAIIFKPSSETSVGTYTLRINDYRLPITLADISVSDVYYTGEPVEPKITVKLNGRTLKGSLGYDYTAEYSYTLSSSKNRIEPGVVEYTITGNAPFQNWKTGKELLKGSVSGSFRIKPAPISLAEVSGLKTSMPYTGYSVTQDLTLKYNGTVLKKGTDYTVAFKNNKNAGTASIVFTGQGHFTGTMTKTFTIRPLSIKNASVSLSAALQGGSVAWGLDVDYDGTLLTEGKDYTVSGTVNDSDGTYTAVIKGKGNYSGTITKTVKIKSWGQKSLSGLITAEASRYASASSTSASGKLKEGTKVKLLLRSGSRWKVQTGSTVCWVDAHYVFNTASAEPKASDRVGQGVTTKTVTVYTSPTTGSSEIAVLKKGVLRNLYAQSGNWYQIYTGGRYGWVRVDGFDYTKSVSRGRLAQVKTLKKIQTYYGPGADYVKSIVIPANAPLNIYKKEGSWALVYRTGKFLWVRLTSSNAK